MKKGIPAKDKQTIEKYKSHEEIIHPEGGLAGMTNKKFIKPWTWENKFKEVVKWVH